VTSASNPRCPGRGRIVKMWVLSKSPASGASVQQSAQVNATEEARRQQGINQILNAHGVPTPQPAKENAENSD
jgi:GTP cyclohydrolase II